MIFHGIDVSSHQGSINWPRAAAAGVQFAMLRAGWSWYQGGMNIDKQFLNNVAGVQQAGLPWGAYLYAYDKTPAAARASARRLAELLREYQIPYPVAYDFEDSQYLTMSRAQNTAIVKAFLEELQSLGFYGMLYTYANFALGFLDMAQLAAYDFWLADYRPQPGYPGEFGIWQYSATGKIDGIAGNTDLDDAYRDYPAVIREAGLNGFGGGEAGGEEELEQLRRQVEELRAALQNAQQQAETLREQKDDILAELQSILRDYQDEPV